MAAAANGERQSLTAGEIDGADDVGDTGAAGDDRGVPVVGAVPDAAFEVVLGVAGPDCRSAEARGELGDGRLPDAGRGGFGDCHAFLLVCSCTTRSEIMELTSTRTQRDLNAMTTPSPGSCPRSAANRASAMMQPFPSKKAAALSV